jgi:hypothetical protein
LIRKSLNPKWWVSGNLLATSAAGTYTVVASFAGSADYSAARSGPVTFTIGAGTAAIALTSSAGSTDYGQSITFVANVAASVAPGGTVTFLDGGTTLAKYKRGNGSTPSLALFDVAHFRSCPEGGGQQISSGNRSGGGRHRRRGHAANARRSARVARPRGHAANAWRSARVSGPLR